MKTSTRRTFIKAAGTTSAGVLLSGLPRGWTDGVHASDAPETPAVRLGIIALTDCSPIVIAHELGYLKKFGIQSTISGPPISRSGRSSASRWLVRCRSSPGSCSWTNRSRSSIR